MRSSFGSKNEAEFGFGVESDPEFAQVAASPDQFAAVWNAVGEVVTASPLPNGVPGSFPVDIEREPSGSESAAAVSLRRVRDLKLPALSQGTHYLTAVNEYSERTRILALDGQRLSLDDEDLLEWLINAEQQMLLGTDSHPVFETSLEDTACSIRRLPNGYISMTEVPRHHIQALGQRIRSLAGDRPGTPIRVSIETPLRCAARYFLTATDEGQGAFGTGKAAEVTAFLVLTSAGYSFGLWSPQAGLFSEYAFLAPDEIKLKGRETDGAGDRAVEAYIQQAFVQLRLQMSQNTLENLQLSNYAQVVWATEKNLLQIMAPVAGAFAAKTGIEFVPLNIPVDEAIAHGLLMGSYAFGQTTVAGAEILPPINLAHDILVAADTGEIERHRDEEARLQSRKNKVLMTMLAAPVIAAACILALIANLLVSMLILSWRDSSAEARTNELRPALERRKTYEANLKWYQEFIAEVSQLRKQQPIGIGLLYQLNENYPFNIDPAFLISEMKVSKDGKVEMSGLSRNKEAVTSFLRALEFAGGAESGSRLFSDDLTYEVQETAPPSTVGQSKLPALTGSTLGGIAVAPGVVKWNMKGTYLPVAQLIPKPPPAAGQPGAPTQPGQTPNPIPAAPATATKPAA